MIINDQYRFAFIHIPKCAGTSVRNPLRSLDDCNGFYTSHVDEHSSLGLLDYVHIPLFVLKDHFASDFDKVENYWSFAFIRDPFSRFPSSISQRLKRYGGEPIHKLTMHEIKKEVDESISFLTRQPRDNHLLPAEYIHFQKQVDYVRINDENVVDTIFKVDEVGLLLEKLSLRVGRDLNKVNNDQNFLHANRTVVHRNEAIRNLVEWTRPVSRLLSNSLPASSREKLRKIVYVPRDGRLEKLFHSSYINEFIEDYYRDDLELWEKLNL